MVRYPITEMVAAQGDWGSPLAMIGKGALTFTMNPQGKHSENWDNIEKVEPDEIGLQMLEEIKADPDCHSFVSSEEAMKELDL